MKRQRIAPTNDKDTLIAGHFLVDGHVDGFSDRNLDGRHGSGIDDSRTLNWMQNKKLSKSNKATVHSIVIHLCNSSTLSDH